MKRPAQKGFSLIELIVVVAILGVISAIAIPMYTNYRNSAHRAAGKAALVEGAQTMERLFTRSPLTGYATATVGNLQDDTISSTSEGGAYVLSFHDPTNPNNPGDPTTTAYVLRATPVFTDKCGWLAIDQTGAKTSEFDENCW